MECLGRHLLALVRPDEMDLFGFLSGPTTNHEHDFSSEKADLPMKTILVPSGCSMVSLRYVTGGRWMKML